MYVPDPDMSPGRGPSHRPVAAAPAAISRVSSAGPPDLRHRLWAVALSRHIHRMRGWSPRVGRGYSRDRPERPPRATALRSARRAPRGNDARATSTRGRRRGNPRARACPRNICTGPVAGGRIGDRRELSSSRAPALTSAPTRPPTRTGPTTKTRWTTAPTSRRRASPSARSSSTRTRLARPGSRRTPRARHTALGSTLTCGAASITAWRPSCSRTRSEGRDVAARAPLLLIVSTTLVSSGGDGPFNSFQSRVVCIRRPGRVYKSVSTRAKSQ